MTQEEQSGFLEKCFLSGAHQKFVVVAEVETISREEIKKVLSEIIDPELGADIVSLGFVKDIKIENGKVTIKLKLTIPGCPLVNFFLEEIKNEVKKIKGVSTVKVDLVT